MMTFAGSRLRPVIAVLAGVVMIFILSLILNRVSAGVSASIYQTHSQSEALAVMSQPPYSFFFFGLQIVFYLAFVLSGVVTGWVARQKGWLTAGVAALVLSLISFGIQMAQLMMTLSVLQSQHGSGYPAPTSVLVSNLVLEHLKRLPINMILMAAGGVVGEKLTQQRHHTHHQHQSLSS